MRSFFWFVTSFCIVSMAHAQQGQTPKRWNHVLEVSAMPAYSSRLITGYSPDEAGGYTQQQLQDSFAITDKSLQTLNFFVTYQNRKKKYSGITVGGGIVTSGFDRVKTGSMLGYEIHPSLEVYDNQVIAAEMQVHYEFRSTYLAGILAWDKRLDGSGFQIKQGSLWMQAGLMPALLLNHGLKINTTGFMLPEGNGLLRDDVYGRTADTGIVWNKASASQGNVFVTLSGTLEYELSVGMRIGFTPRIMLPLLPNARGAQTYWSPLFGLQIGLCVPIEN